MELGFVTLCFVLIVMTIGFVVTFGKALFKEYKKL